MEVTIEIPDPKFSKGDVLRWGDLIIHVHCVSFNGTWSNIDGIVSMLPERCQHYHVTVQGGKGPEGDLIRPGLVLTLPEVGDHNFQLCDAERIEWSDEIVGPDSMGNLGERWKSWKEQND